MVQPGAQVQQTPSVPHFKSPLHWSSMEQPPSPTSHGQVEEQPSAVEQQTPSVPHFKSPLQWSSMEQLPSPSSQGQVEEQPVVLEQAVQQCPCPPGQLLWPHPSSPSQSSSRRQRPAPSAHGHSAEQQSGAGAWQRAGSVEQRLTWHTARRDTLASVTSSKSPISRSCAVVPLWRCRLLIKLLLWPS